MAWKSSYITLSQNYRRGSEAGQSLDTSQPSQRARLRPLWDNLGALARLAQNDLDVHLALAAIDGHGHGIAGAMLVHDVGKVLLVADRVTVDGNDEVAADHDGRRSQIRALTATLQTGAF